MRSDRLTRKTHLKKLSARPEAEVAVYDFTEEALYGGEALALHEFGNKAHKLGYEDIEALPGTFRDERDVLFWCAAMMADSPLASSLWKDAESKGWCVALDDLGGSGFYLDVPEKTLLLDHFSLNPSALGRSPYFRNALLMTFVRALRDIWHEQRCGAFEDRFGPENVLMLERIRSADCDTLTILVGWEMRGAGYTDVWRHLLGSGEGDMAMVFSRYLERDPKALYDGSVLTQVFRQWYVDRVRVDGCDHATLESLDELLFVCASQNPFGSDRVDAQLLELLTRTPDGTCYLRALGESILSDPFYAGLNDPVNQTHLFHLMYDLEVVMVNNVPFRDRALARKIFPEGEVS